MSFQDAALLSCLGEAKTCPEQFFHSNKDSFGDHKTATKME